MKAMPIADEIGLCGTNRGLRVQVLRLVSFAIYPFQAASRGHRLDKGDKRMTEKEILAGVGLPCRAALGKGTMQ